jgi:HK97 family phage major capsid protein
MSTTATPDAALKDRLKAVRAAISEARDDRAAKAKAREDAKQAFADAKIEGPYTDSQEFKDAETAVGALGEVDDQLADLQLAERGILSMLGQDAPAPDENGPTGPDSPGVQALTGRWNAEAILKGENYEKFLATGGATSNSAIGAVNLGELANREQAAAFLGGGQFADRPMAAELGSSAVGGMIAPDRRGVVAPHLKPLTLLDLFPVGTTDSNMIEYVQIVAIPNSAAETAEGALKPEQTLTTQDADAPVRTIAGWLKVRRQALADAAGLRSLLGLLLPYDVRRRIESQMLVGDGTGQNLSGILDQTGIGAPAWVDGDNVADAILRAITVIYLSDGDPNFTALHPLTWQDLLLMRENQAERTGAYLYGSPASPAAPTIWGLAITNNRAIPAASPLVGDSMAAMLLVREGVNLRVSDSDQDDFVKNRATLLAEARVAFPIWRPASFAVATTEDPTP